MNHFARPRVVVSLCLGFEHCRYDGSVIPNEIIAALGRYVDFVSVCPEVEIGLGTPRPPIRLVQTTEGIRLVQPSTERDLTETMQRFSRQFLDRLEPVDGFILKNRSPSCSVRDATLYASNGKGRLGKRPGMFGQAVLDRFGDLPVEDEGRLTNRSIREHFFTAIFALAALRQVVERGGMHDLVTFHARYKLILMAYNQQRQKELGRIVANAEKLPFDEVALRYTQSFRRALQRPPRRPSVINVLMHALGYFSDNLTADEKAHFLDLLTAYREGRLPLVALTSLLRSWILRFEEPYLSEQAFFQPFPEALTSLKDSGGREGWV